MNTIPLSVPNLSIDSVESLKECITTGFVSSSGRFITEFESKLAMYLQVKEVVGIQSGTEALHLVYQYFGFKECEVIMPTVTFVATVNPLLYVGGAPIFMDCDDTLNMDLDKLEQFCQNECESVDGTLINKNTRKPIKGLVVVHVFGNPINMERVMDIAKVYHLKVIEDAAESLGSYYTTGRYKGCYTGTIGDAGVYSFNANKIITTGGGGAIVSNHSDLLKKVRFWSVQSKKDPVYFTHDELGYNFRFLNINAAIGCSQLYQLEKFIHIKKVNYKRYLEHIKVMKGLRLLPFDTNCRCNYWFYSLIVDESYGLSRDLLLAKLNQAGIQTRPLWGLMHEQGHLKGFQTYRIEKALYYRDHLLNIPCSTNLQLVDLFTVIKALNYKYEHNTLVSIITPVYNSSKVLSETIESVRNQSYTNWELLLVDDCSTDDSLRIIKQYSEKDKRIKYMHLDHNSGAAVARNVALRHAYGRYVAFLDSDDVWKPQKLATQLAFLEANQVGFCFSQYDILGEFKTIRVPAYITYSQLLKNTIIGCLTVLIDKKLIGEFEMPLVRGSQDYATWLMILKKGHLAYGIQETLATYRRTEKSISRNKFKALLSNWKVYRKLEKLSLTKALYVFTFYVGNALKKHLFAR